MINIVIPMAGEGSRFSEAGYKKPKPFIDVDGSPMIKKVLDNLKYKDASYILIAQKKHLLEEQQLVKEINNLYNVTWVTIEQLTEGTACTVLFARELLNNDTPLLIANSDQIVDGGIGGLVDDAIERKLDGSILCFKDDERDPKWSFAKVDENMLVTEVREKEPISDCATVGIYYFGKGCIFVDAAIDMIVRNERVNNEFYTCPVYNQMIQKKLNIGVFMIDQKRMHGIGTPSDLLQYLNMIDS